MTRRSDDWMWAEACEFIRRAERLQQRFFEPAPRPAGGRVSWQPPMDVFDTGEALHLIVALPGVPAERVEVVIQDGTVTVGGERPLALPAHRAGIHRLELPHGRFERRVTLPAGRYRLRERAMRDGCLHVVLERLE